MLSAGRVSILPGDPGSPVILHVPHASRELTPGARDALRLDDAALADELDHLTDAHTDLIALRAAVASPVRPWIFANELSRLVVDPERFPDEREEMRAVGMGAVYTHGYARRRLRDDDPARDAELIRTYFDPYAQRMTDLVAARLAAAGRAVIIDVHSYSTVPLPYELHGDGPRPQICLGVDAFHTPPAVSAAAIDAFGAYSTAVDTPFAGAYVPLDYYGVEDAVSALMIEIRRDTYMSEPGGPPDEGLGAVADGLTALVARLT
ncbi:N-formylglutamate amidohydrolase [Actinoplanes bogorensis]|uniref:N-formylglutamate amidohydrolase n=1 Tax=Paractinoplanes bogorensis TaxID=1610840 RepID=A0ABS5Z0F4_9ACTN|nr:N-formylglutamate amidohydrolase [Actinoplanes bogorensis]MBU2669176.1 N-formylglutamate amidohydrolase [Actinoplanes bogorensis]